MDDDITYVPPRSLASRIGQRKAGTGFPHLDVLPLRVGGVYFVQMGAGGPIKIGTTINCKRRMRKMQTDNPYPLRLLALQPEWGSAEERSLHSRFAVHKLLGEWFNPAPEIIELAVIIGAPQPRSPRAKSRTEPVTPLPPA